MSELTDKELEAIKSLNAEYRQAMFKRVASEQDGLYVLVDNRREDHNLRTFWLLQNSIYHLRNSLSL